MEQAQDIQEKGFTPIENPLPLPKRHVKSTLTYDLESMEGMDFYDITVSQQDDYDLT